MVLSFTEAPVADLIFELESQLPSFKLHTFVKRSQQKYFEEKRKALEPNDLILQIDFAENYRLISQNEIQSAHFSYAQVTIFTCVAWLHGCTKSFAIISDQLTHNKYDVYCFLSILIKNIQKHHSVSKIRVFSDGCGSQFKNKFILRSIPKFKNEFGVNHFEWNFFATSHGKGAVDGVGAIVKRKVWQLVRAQNLILKDAHDFYRPAKSNIDGVKLIYVTENDIKTTTQYLGEK